MGIQPKKKLCAGCNQPQFIWKTLNGEKYCKQCSFKIDKPIIKKQATKAIILNQQYSKLRKTFLQQTPICQAHIHNICSFISTDIHHRRGRGKYFLDVTTWFSVCRNCHTWIHQNDTAARELGFIENRLHE